MLLIAVACGCSWVTVTGVKTCKSSGDLLPPSNSSLPHGRSSRGRFGRSAGLLPWRSVSLCVLTYVVSVEDRREGLWTVASDQVYDHRHVTPYGVSILGGVCKSAWFHNPGQKDAAV